MQYSIKSKILLLALIIGIIPNSGVNNQAESISSPPPVIDLTGPDYRMKGPGRILASEGNLKSSTGCHFEIPLDAKCSLICGRGENRYSREEIQRTILGLTTAFLLWQTGVDPSGASWWSAEGHNSKTLCEAGYIMPIVRE